MTKDQIETIKWKLMELEAAEPEQIESNDFEICGEDEQGLSGICTIQINKTASDALALIKHLQEI